MADYLAMNSGGNNFYQNTEHYIKRVLTGNVASVRLRLSAVLERLDYDFIDDEGEFEIQARRNSRGWAGAYASADVLEYPRTLIIKLKPLSESSTRASFAYIIKHPSLNRGEKEVLTREAETIVKLATIRATDKICTVCGTESTDEFTFLPKMRCADDRRRNRPGSSADDCRNTFRSYFSRVERNHRRGNHHRDSSHIADTDRQRRNQQRSFFIVITESGF